MTYEEFREWVTFIADEINQEILSHLRADDDGMPEHIEYRQSCLRALRDSYLISSYPKVAV